MEKGQKAPSAKRCIKTNLETPVVVRITFRQKAPSAKRRIKTFVWHLLDDVAHITGQKAPSTKRCIKTRDPSRPRARIRVRKHRAPNGAL